MKHLFSIALMLFCFVAVAQASPMIEADQNTYELTVEHPEDVLMVTDQEVTINDAKPLAYVNDVGSINTTPMVITHFEKDHQTFTTYLRSRVADINFKEFKQSTFPGFKSLINSPPNRGIS